MITVKELMKLQAESYPELLKGYAWNRRDQGRRVIELLAIIPLHDNLDEALYMSKDHIEYRYFELMENVNGG